MKVMKHGNLLLSKDLYLLYRQKNNRKNTWEYNNDLYERRNEIEQYFLRIKCFRRVFLRYDKLDVLYLGVITLAMIFDAIFI